MPKRKTILYLSDNSESEDEPCQAEPELGMAEMPPEEPHEALEQPPDPAPDIKVKVRARDLKGKHEKLLACASCNRPYKIESALRKHEANCPVKTAAEVKWAKDLKKQDEAKYKQLKRKEYNQTQKERKDQARPVVVKKRGRPLKPIVIEESDTESDEEPAPVRPSKQPKRPKQSTNHAYQEYQPRFEIRF